jgi:hypothetical protein
MGDPAWAGSRQGNSHGRLPPVKCHKRAQENAKATTLTSSRYHRRMGVGTTGTLPGVNFFEKLLPGSPFLEIKNHRVRRAGYVEQSEGLDHMRCSASDCIVRIVARMVPKSCLAIAA